MRAIRIVMLMMLAIIASKNAFADLIFSAPPRGSEAEERATYEPLVQAISKAINEKVTYVFPRNFIQYSVNMQKGRYDIVFDGPHFSEWRVVNLHHTILVNLPEYLQFLVVTPKGRIHVNTMHDLVYQKICAQVTPQLGTLMLLENYVDTATEPRLRLVQGEDKVFTEFSNGKCSAAVLRDKTFYKMSKAQRADYKIIYTSPVAPNDAITANNKLSVSQKKKLVALLTNPEAMKVAAPIFRRFSRNAVAFNVAKPNEFQGLDKLLQLAFGWESNTRVAATRN